MGEHTKTPWDFDTDDLAIWINSPAYPQPIAKMGACRDFDQKANAAFIVKAVNSHEALVSALCNCRDRLKMDLDEVQHLRRRLSDSEMAERADQDEIADEADKQAIAEATEALNLVLK